MRNNFRHRGSILIVVVFAIALMAAVIAGILQTDSERIGLMRNQIYLAESKSIAQAGLEDAFSRIRVSGSTGNFSSNFGGGSYVVVVNGNTIVSTGTSAQNFVTRLSADITIGSASPYIVRVNSLRINE